MNFPSSSLSLIIRFDANGGSDIGFRIFATYLTPDQLDDDDVMARTGCGGFVETRGGAITMMNMVKPPENESNSSESGVFFDCIWLVRPAQSFSFLKTHISLKVETFEDMGSPSAISIIEGQTSVGRLLETVESSSIGSVSSKNFVTSITSGFYIRLRGKFTHESRLAIVYTAFSYSSKLLLALISCCSCLFHVCDVTQFCCVFAENCEHLFFCFRARRLGMI